MHSSSLEEKEIINSNYFRNLGILFQHAERHNKILFFIYN